MEHKSIENTKKHIERVRELMVVCIEKLIDKADNHDNSKLEEPEVSIFDEFTPKLKYSTYGSEQYFEFLKKMKPALDHHYENNRHHPEHFENGIKDMNILDLLEMIVDWKAASERHENGNIFKSIELNQERFKYSDEIKNILISTAKLLEE